MSSTWKLILFVITACSVADAQESASVRGPDIVKAGESVELGISLDRAPNFDGGSVLVCVSCPGFSQQSGCSFRRGERECRYSFTVPPDVASGKCHVDMLKFFTGSRTIDLRFDGLVFQVIASRGLILPTSAEATANPSQVQLLRREAAQLQMRLQALKASLSGHTRTQRRSTTSILRSNVEEEIKSLGATESTFSELGGKSYPEVAKIFFDDLRISYAAVLSALSRRELNSDNPRVTTATWTSASQKSRDEGYSLDAQAVFRVFEINELAYTLVGIPEL